MNKISFRDPSGCVVVEGDRIFRILNLRQVKFYREIFNEKWYKKLVKENKIQNTLDLCKSTKEGAWFEHKKFFFPLYPHEISVSHLHDAALLTINLAIEAFEYGYILKDASAWNVVVENGSPILCDATSFEKYDGASLWAAYGQYCRHFIIPLIIYKYAGISPADIFLKNRDGMTPKDARKILGIRGISTLSALETIYLPAWFEGDSLVESPVRHASNGSRVNEEIFIKTLHRLSKIIESLDPLKFSKKTVWSSYDVERGHYEQSDLLAKSGFVSEVLNLCSDSVLDLGCNSGEYSIKAADLGLHVVATDFDEGALMRLNKKIIKKNISVALLNITNPTPAVGWENKECSSFLSRANNKFELVLCLGLIHHLFVTDRVPLDSIVSMLCSMSYKYVLIEWIDPRDIMFRGISRFNGMPEGIIDCDAFIEKISSKLTLKNSITICNGDRKLLLFEKK